MYVIGNVVYGIPLLEGDSSRMQELDIGEEELEDAGWEIMYHGSWPWTVAYLGIRLGRFDEAGDHFRLSELHVTPTDDQKEQFLKLFGHTCDVLPREFIDNLSGPDVWVVWSSS
jgi:hypothetical protein